MTATAAQWQVSKDGGAQPRWRRDGEELFYLTPEGKMMAVAIQETGNGIEAGPPAELFHTGMSDVRPKRSDYDVTPDGQRFLVILPENSTQNPIHIVLNWTAALNKK